MVATAHQGFPGILLFAVVQNIGRLPVTVQECLWHTEDKGAQHLAFGNVGNPFGTPLPNRLEPGAQCYAVVDLATAIAVVDARATRGWVAWCGRLSSSATDANGRARW